MLRRAFWRAGHAIDEVLAGKIWAASGPQRRASKRQKDLADIARLIAKDTVEERVIELQQRKRERANAILTADQSLIGRLNRDDLEWLLT